MFGRKLPVLFENLLGPRWKCWQRMMRRYSGIERADVGMIHEGSVIIGLR